MQVIVEVPADAGTHFLLQEPQIAAFLAKSLLGFLQHPAEMMAIALSIQKQTDPFLTRSAT